MLISYTGTELNMLLGRKNNKKSPFVGLDGFKHLVSEDWKGVDDIT